MSSSRKPTVSVQKGVTVIALGPDYETLDESVLDELRESLLQMVNAAEPPLVVLDMPHTRFFGSAFLEVLFRAWNRINARHGQFAISGLTQYCHEVVVEISNLDKLWKIKPTVAEAIAALKDE